MQEQPSRLGRAPPPAGPVGSQGPGTIVRLAPDGGTTILPNAPFAPSGLAFDGVDFFKTVSCDACFGDLLRIPGSGASPVAMGEGTFAAVDDACVYYFNPWGIFSVAKSYALPAADAGMPAGSVLCSPTAGPLDASTAVDAGPTLWCTPPHSCEPFNGGWACCFFDTPSTTLCDVIGEGAANSDASD